jgi:hypothetical protein
LLDLPAREAIAADALINLSVEVLLASPLQEQARAYSPVTSWLGTLPPPPTQEALLPNNQPDPSTGILPAGLPIRGLILPNTEPEFAADPAILALDITAPKAVPELTTDQVLPVLDATTLNPLHILASAALAEVNHPSPSSNEPLSDSSYVTTDSQ